MNTPGTLDHAFHSVGGRDTAIAMARLASFRDPQIEEIIVAYENLPKSQRFEPGLLERLSLAVGLHPSEFFGRVAAAAYKHNFEVATFLASLKVRDIIERSSEFAQEPGGFKDRELIAKIARVMPEAGPLVQVNTQVNTQVAAGLPPVEGVTGKVSQLIREPQQTKLLEENIIDGEVLGFHVAETKQDNEDGNLS